ncbi:hypothetical protein FXO38_31967 [Capsicum annuum]|uniref:Uncharacterized protein n=1 Tax=Capsicum annuum TaxID=4072 RepID=A0A2G3A6X7_CAPAN|nr:hypothetical protein FXO38_31967 [Capsicum annuum]KAF3622017.1 hypothetical protein FXO37_32497 [Capsicum annuum]PHT89943.1 hypothetical protein T459_05056 [Capsicum annuum]
MYSELNKRIFANCINAQQEQNILQDLQDENASFSEKVTMIFNMIDHIEENVDDSNGIDLELRLKGNDDTNGPDLELRLG